MPRVRVATVRADDLPDVATVAEFAAFERVDERTVRKALEAGEIPGAFKRGRSWRIRTDVYFALGCHLGALGRRSPGDDDSWGPCGRGNTSSG